MNVRRTTNLLHNQCVPTDCRRVSIPVCPLVCYYTCAEVADEGQAAVRSRSPPDAYASYLGPVPWAAPIGRAGRSSG